jgi:hypothetical protein
MKHFCRCPANRELKVVQILKFLGFDAEVLSRKKAVKRGISAKARIAMEQSGRDRVAIIPGSIIVNFTGPKPWLWHRLCDAGIVRRGPTLKVTNEDIEEFMKRHADASEIHEPVKMVLRPGDMAKIADGPVQGMKFVVKEVTGKTATGFVNGTPWTVKLSNLQAV